RNPDRSLSYPTRRSSDLPDSFSYKANDGSADSNVATVSINVAPVNDAPVAQNDTAATNEDTPVSGNVLANDSDVDGDALSAILVSGPAHGSLTLNADGSFTYTPTANYNGAHRSSYKAQDGSADSNVATVSINVTPVNDAPAADADKTITVAEDSANTTLGIAAPTDVDGDPLTITVTGVPNASIGTVYLSDGT